MTSNRVCRAAHKPQTPVANLYATPAGQRIDNSVSVPNEFSCGGGIRREAVGDPRKSAPASVAQLAPSAVLEF